MDTSAARKRCLCLSCKKKVEEKKNRPDRNNKRYVVFEGTG